MCWTGRAAAQRCGRSSENMRICEYAEQQTATPADTADTADTAHQHTSRHRPQREFSLSGAERNARLLTKMGNISDGDSQPRSVTVNHQVHIGTWHLAWPAGVSSARSLGPMGSWSVLSLLIVIAIKKNRTEQHRKKQNRRQEIYFLRVSHFRPTRHDPKSYPQRSSNPVTHTPHARTHTARTRSFRLGQIADNSHPVIPCFGFAGQGRLKSSNPGPFNSLTLHF
jgi:hypothetical protein